MSIKKPPHEPIWMPPARSIITPAAPGGGGAWTPASIPGVVDYGIWTDLTRLKQNSNGTGDVVNVGDPVGYWKGQLDVMTLVQGDASKKFEYTASGLKVYAVGTEKSLVDSSVIIAAGTAGTVGVRWDLIDQYYAGLWTGHLVYDAPTFFAPLAIIPNLSDGYYTTGVVAKGSQYGSMSPVLHTGWYTGEMSATATYDGATSVAGWRNAAAKVTGNSLSGTDTSIGFFLKAHYSHTRCNAKGWFHGTQQISDEDAALLQAFWATL